MTPRTSNGIRYEPAYAETELFAVPGLGVVEDTPCVYCGDRASADEHLMPYVQLVARQVTADTPKLTWLVPACRDCNAYAGSMVFETPHAKRDYIRERLRVKLMSMPDGWDEAELADLGLNLRREAQRITLERELLESRIKYNGRLPRRMLMDM